MRPYVVIHNAVSVNGFLTGFDVDMGLYYRLAGQLGCDADLVGSGTIMAAPESAEEDDPSEAFEPSPDDSKGSLLVVADGRGRVKCWSFLQRSGFWGGFASLTCASTPQEHVDYLGRRGVRVIEAGGERVDLAVALETLGREMHVERLRTDSGGTLNAALLAAGLVDEISLLVMPVVVSTDEVPLFSGAIGDGTCLDPVREERLEGSAVWLRYRVGPSRPLA